MYKLECLFELVLGTRFATGAVRKMCFSLFLHINNPLKESEGKKVVFIL